MRRARSLLALGLALAAFGPRADADEETAQYFLSRGREELGAGRIEKAKHWIERALKEQPDYAPAHLLSADVALKEGRPEEAKQRLEACLKRADAEGASDVERSAVREARKRLRELDKARFEFQEIVDDYVRRVSDLAQKSARDDAELARACWKNVLLVDPGHEAAKKAIDGIAPVQGDGEAIFNGKDLDKWNGTEPGWVVKRGVLVGSQRDAANVNRYEPELGDHYSIVCEMRIVEDIGTIPAFAILFGFRNKYDNFGLWIWNDCWAYQHATTADHFDELASKKFKHLDGKYNRFEWNTYRIDVEEKKVTAYVNGKKIWSTSGAVRKLDGWIALKVQDQTVEIRRIQLVRK